MVTPKLDTAELEELAEQNLKLADDIQTLQHKIMGTDPIENADLEGLKGTLDKKWTRFLDSHQELLKYQSQLKKNRYFREGTEGKVKTLVTAALTKLDHLAQVQKTAESKVSHQETKLEVREESDLVKKVRFNLACYARSIQRCKSGRGSLELLKDSKTNTEKLMTELAIEKGHEQLIQEFVELNDECFLLFSNTSNVKDERQYIKEEVNFTLPQIDIPIFDGRYEKWNTFKELFDQLIGSRSIPNTQKMVFLKTKLTGNASRLIENLEASDTSFDVAWKLLNDKFTNKRALANNFFNRIVNAPNVTESAKSVQNFQQTTEESLQGLKTLGVSSEDLLHALLNFILLQKLDENLRLKYENSLTDSKELQTVDTLYKFLNHEFYALEAVQNSFCSKSSYGTRPTFTVKKCLMGCGTTHNLALCSKFGALNKQAKWDKVLEAKLCQNCLRSGHSSKTCYSPKCRVCNGQHHSILHKEKASVKTALATNVGRKSSQNSDTNVILSTALVGIKNTDGEYINARALLDTGSQLNLITEKFKNKLNIASEKHCLVIEGVSNNKTTANELVTLSLKSKEDNFYTEVKASVIQQIISNVPSEKINIGTIPQNIILADPTYDVPGEIDILLGAGLFYKLIKSEQIKMEPNIIFQNSVLGWVVCGTTPSIIKTSYCGVITKNTDELSIQLKRFWELESTEKRQVHRTQEEKICEGHFYKNVSRGVDGKFTVALPFKASPNKLGDSECQARKRFYSLEKRLESNEELRKQYHQFIKEYINMGHMDEIRNIRQLNNKYFLPHHCILKPENSTTKLRVVFDASCKTSTNISLNSILHTGPRLQEDLFNILLRFRKHRYVISADIEKMYRQIWIQEQDLKYQLIFWRWSKEEQLKTYALKTVTYGTSAAPYLAVKCLQKIAEDEGSSHPELAQIIKSDFYMDDLMTGGESLNELISYQKGIAKILDKYGFHLRKWCANHNLLLEGIPENEKEIQLEFNKGKPEELVKALGIVWKPTTDLLSLKYNGECNIKKATKRSILSDISKLFDPLGLVNPVIVTAKILMQQLWKLKSGWDDKVPDSILENWIKLKTGLTTLNEISIPRRLICNEPNVIELHAFSDASMKAYGAVVYVKSKNSLGEICINIAAAKSRVAPVKIVTLPRLELCAAVLLVELVLKVIESLKIQCKTYYYTDSTIVLNWIKIDPAALQIFVSNRVNFIQSNSEINDWKHIDSKNNPADLISRGLFAEELLNNQLWFNGPSILTKDKIHTPPIPKPDNLPDIKKKTIVAVGIIKTTFLEKINHKNDFNFFQNVVAKIIKFKDILKKNTIHHDKIYQKEALIVIIKHIQQQYFSEEIKLLKKNKNVAKNSKLATLAPIVDESGILRVGGRIQNCRLSEEAKHPILLPYDNEWVTLLMNWLHKKHLHIGPQGLLAIVRQKFWPLRGRQLMTKVVNKCYRCFRVNPRPLHQLMGNLPKDRVINTRPFLNTGIDFLGPLKIHHKIKGKRIDKAYACTFVCFATKAVHIEVVSDLSSAAFIGALKRFVARRSCPLKIYSDNGTNFIGAANSLHEIYLLFQNEIHNKQLQSFCAQRNIKWINIPARSPHFGGLWEATVKSIKKHFFRVVEGILTFEEMCTLMAEIEAILNSRPLTPLSENPNDLQVLTPGHFLIGEPLSTIVDASDNQCYHGLRDHWKTVEKNAQEFWNRWSIEYLSELQKRTKWQTPKENIKPGTLVLLKEDNIPPMNWRRGRIINVIHGKDGKSRIVDVRTSTGISQRAIHNVCPFPTQEMLAQTQEIEKELETPIIRRSARIKNKNCLLSLLLLLCMLPFIICAKISRLDNSAGIFYEKQGTIGLTKTSWNILIHVDLHNYEKDKKYVTKSMEMIRSMKAHMAKNWSHEWMMKQIELKMTRIKQNDDIIHLTKRQRKPRSPLAFIGSIFHSVFGLMDEEHAEILLHKVNQGQKNEEYLLNLLKNQTSIQDATKEVMKQLNDANSKNYQFINNSLITIINAMSEKMNSDIALEAMNRISADMDLLEELQKDITDVMWNTRGSFIQRLLPMSTFLQQIHTITSNIQDNLQLPTTQLLDILRTARTTVRTINTSIMFKIEIPLIDKEKMELYAAYAYPTNHDGYFVSIKPIVHHILMDKQKTLYYALESNDFHRCQQLQDITICQQTHPLYNINEDNPCEVQLLARKEKRLQKCEVTIMKKRNVWIQLHAKNSWLFSMANNTQATENCNGTKTSLTLEGQGILQLKANCYLQTLNTRLWAYTDFTTEVEFAIPKLNISTHLPPMNHLKLKGEMETFSMPNLPIAPTIFGFPIDLDLHHLTHYSISATNLMLLLIGFVGLLILVRSLHRKTKTLMPIGGFNFI